LCKFGLTETIGKYYSFLENAKKSIKKLAKLFFLIIISTTICDYSVYTKAIKFLKKFGLHNVSTVSLAHIGIDMCFFVYLSISQ
jgi:hypothetical protein